MANHPLQRFDGVGNPEKDLPKAKVWPIAKPSLRAQASQLLPGHRVDKLTARNCRKVAFTFDRSAGGGIGSANMKGYHA
jgi:hypothetical protein